MRLNARLDPNGYDYPNSVYQAACDELDRLVFFTAILLAVSTHRAQSLEVLEDFIANLKDTSARG